MAWYWNDPSQSTVTDVKSPTLSSYILISWRRFTFWRRPASDDDDRSALTSPHARRTWQQSTWRKCAAAASFGNTLKFLHNSPAARWIQEQSVLMYTRTSALWRRHDSLSDEQVAISRYRQLHDATCHTSGNNVSSFHVKKCHSSWTRKTAT